jgi:hypothetical protein
VGAGVATGTNYATGHRTIDVQDAARIGAAVGLPIDAVIAYVLVRTLWFVGSTCVEADVCRL